MLTRPDWVQLVTWLTPYQFSQEMPADVDFRIMTTFVEFYEVFEHRTVLPRSATPAPPHNCTVSARLQWPTVAARCSTSAKSRRRCLCCRIESQSNRILFANCNNAPIEYSNRCFALAFPAPPCRRACAAVEYPFGCLNRTSQVMLNFVNFRLYGAAGLRCAAALPKCCWATQPNQLTAFLPLRCAGVAR